ncbi:MAG: hypothetical protein ACXV3F_15020 [Frankiaceae bacterium]
MRDDPRSIFDPLDLVDRRGLDAPAATVLALFVRVTSRRNANRSVPVSCCAGISPVTVLGGLPSSTTAGLKLVGTSTLPLLARFLKPWPPVRVAASTALLPAAAPRVGGGLLRAVEVAEPRHELLAVAGGLGSGLEPLCLADQVGDLRQFGGGHVAVLDLGLLGDGLGLAGLLAGLLPQFFAVHAGAPMRSGAAARVSARRHVE